MGYSLTIGQAEINYSHDPDDMICNVCVRDEYDKNSPAFGDPTDYTNARWPSYTAWTNFTEWAGLYNMFYEGDFGLLNKHPGCLPLTIDHKRQIDESYERIQTEFPNLVACFNDTPESSYFARLIWLKYWVDWALENCEKPAIQNS